MMPAAKAPVHPRDQRRVHGASLAGHLRGAEMAQSARKQPTAAASGPHVEQRVSRLDWARISDDLDRYGCAQTGPILEPGECASLAGLYARDELFRSRIVMRRHGFGSGEYKYFAYPLPDPIAELRAELYPRLVPVANRWNERMG